MDDAILSAGGLMTYLSEHTTVEVVNIFTKPSDSANTFSAKAFLRQCGYKSATKLFEDREEEDKRAFAILGITPHHLGFVDALWRRPRHLNVVQKALSRILPEFAFLYPVFRLHISNDKLSKHDHEYMLEVGRELKRIASKYEQCYIFCPLAVPPHIDHVFTREVCLANFKDVILWNDFPYNMNNNELEDSPIATSVAPAFTWGNNTDTKLRMIMEYTSQVKAMFPDGNIQLQTEQYYRSL